MARKNRKSKSHLVQDERCQIDTLLASGNSIRNIAKQLNISHSTVVREIQRNKNLKGYNYKKAQKKAIKRRTKASSNPKKMFGQVQALIEKDLREKQTSPEQLAGRLKLYGINISALAIYRYIAKDRKKGGNLHK